MVILLTAALFLLAGRLIVRTGEGACPPLERWTYAATAGAALWIGSTWLLAITHLLTRPMLIARLIVLLVVAVVAVRKERFAFTSAPLLVAPLYLWCAFILWRGAVIPPVSHDALSYHLPKATMYAQRGGFEYFSFLIPAIRTLPINYELLLAEVIVWTHSDALTEWVIILFYLLFAVAAAALAERWWGENRWLAATIILVSAGIPVALLQSGAHKNDLMVAAFMTASLVAAGRWFADANPRALMLMITASALAIGSKPQAGMLAVVLSPFVLWSLRRKPRLLVVSIVVAIAAFVALGGIAYIVNYAHEGSLLNAKDANRQEVEIVPYGDWVNLWQGPYVLLAAPFSRNAYALRVPWADTPWFWRRYEIYFSHLGILFGFAAVAVPFMLRRLTFERVAILAATAITFLILLPVGFRPHGLYTISLPRYALFIVPVIFAMTIAPLALRFPKPTLAVAMAMFVLYSVDCAVHDAFAPLAYVKWAAAHPGTRAVGFDPNRAASVADRAAGRREKIAIDAGFGTWIQPAFGRDLQRPVEFIPGGDGPPLIAEDAKWIAIDRAFTAVWQHPQFDDLSKASRYILRNRPSARDMRVFNALRADSRFELVFYNPRTVQAVFHRVR